MEDQQIKRSQKERQRYAFEVSPILSQACYIGSIINESSRRRRRCCFYFYRLPLLVVMMGPIRYSFAHPSTVSIFSPAAAAFVVVVVVAPAPAFVSFGYRMRLTNGTGYG